MKTLKKSISIILAILMLISVFAIIPFTANAETKRKLTYNSYNIDFDDSVTVVNYNIGEKVQAKNVYYKICPKESGYFSFYGIEECRLLDSKHNEIQLMKGYEQWYDLSIAYLEKGLTYYLDLVSWSSDDYLCSELCQPITIKPNSNIEINLNSYYVLSTNDEGLYKIFCNENYNNKIYQFFDVSDPNNVYIYQETLCTELKKNHKYIVKFIQFYDNDTTSEILNFEFVSSLSSWNGTVSSEFSGGNGNKDNPYLISSEGDLAYLEKIVESGNSLKDKYFEITNDINLNDISDYNQWENNPPKNSWTPIGDKNKPFSGKIDGKGHTINGIYINSTNYYNGLFGYLNKEAEISGLNISNVFIKNTSAILNTFIGGLVAVNSGVIKNCNITGNFVGIAQCPYSEVESNGGNAMGTLVGLSHNGKIFNCENNCQNSVFSLNNKCFWGYYGGAGGIVGYFLVDEDYDNQNECFMCNCSNKSKLSFSIEDPDNDRGYNIGGIIGSYEYCGKIINVCNNGSITCNSSLIKYASIGGVLAYANADLSLINSYNSGNINLNIKECCDDQSISIGGISGEGFGYYNGGIKNSYNIGKININNKDCNANTGEIIGVNNYNCNDSKLVKNVFWLSTNNNFSDTKTRDYGNEFDESQVIKGSDYNETLIEKLNNWFKSALDVDITENDLKICRLWKIDKNQNYSYPVFDDTQPIVTKPSDTTPDVTQPVVTEPVATTPDVTQPVVTEPVVTTPNVTEPTQPAPSKPSVTTKKDNPIKVTAKTKTVKAKKLKKKAQKVKAITVKNNQGKVTYKLIKSGITKKIRKLSKINSKGVITIKKWKKAKKGTYKIKVQITAAGNSQYNAKTITKVVKVKIK